MLYFNATLLGQILGGILMERMHKEFIDRAVDYFKTNPSIIGVAVGGSFITGETDRYSDIDFVIVSTDEDYESIMKNRFSLVEPLGDFLSGFTGEHVFEPRVIICLYDNPLLHVDFKFIKLNDFAKRVENPKILFERDNLITKALAEGEVSFPTPSIQWVEDRFWIWIHYQGLKLGRGEIFEAIEFVSYLRQNVIGPFILMKCGNLPRGVRNLERDATNYLDKLKKTVAEYSKESCLEATYQIIELYLEIREHFADDSFVYQEKTQTAALNYLLEIK